LNTTLPEDDAEAIRFLWYLNESLSRSSGCVPFGLTSSPFLLRSVIRKHLKLFEESHPATVCQIGSQRYVDDIPCEASNIGEAAVIQETAVEWNMNRIIKFIRLVRRTAWILRFWNRLRNRQSSDLPVPMDPITFQQRESYCPDRFRCNKGCFGHFPEICRCNKGRLGYCPEMSRCTLKSANGGLY
jgi:hypothetical protein